MNKTDTSGADTLLSVGRFDALVLDLDGVITQTAKVHAAAWKTTFDDFLAKHTAEGGCSEPFDIETDYRQYVDGKPRYDGVRSFLQSRGIDLPEGRPDDGSDQETICGLGNRKNELFREKLRHEGVEVYASTISLIRTLRRAGLRTAVVSSSRNCRAVLEAAGISDLFDACVDGVELQKCKLAGKPAPDMFIEASRRLACEPHRCIGIEDATAGVQAARAAGFGCVIGVNRGDRKEALLEHGADIVVSDLGELQLALTSGYTPSTRQLPSALDHLDEMVRGHDRQPVLFLDYDGTLTPIVPHPNDAILTDTMRATLQRLARLCKIAIISGRDLVDVRERVGIKGIWYAGSHGFDISGPNGEHTEYEEGRNYLPALDAAEHRLREKLDAIPGCLVERKQFAVTAHYRQVAEDQVDRVKQVVDQINFAHTGLRLTTGKKIYELQPDIDWNKGKALRWLMQALGTDTAHFIPLYIGDDTTDEDAFRELAADGIGILVAEKDQPTHAAYRLDDPGEVQQFLDQLYDKLARLGP